MKKMFRTRVELNNYLSSLSKEEQEPIRLGYNRDVLIKQINSKTIQNIDDLNDVIKIHKCFIKEKNKLEKRKLKRLYEMTKRLNVILKTVKRTPYTDQEMSNTDKMFDIMKRVNVKDHKYDKNAPFNKRMDKIMSIIGPDKFMEMVNIGDGKPYFDISSLSEEKQKAVYPLLKKPS